MRLVKHEVEVTIRTAVWKYVLFNAFAAAFNPVYHLRLLLEQRIRIIDL